VKWRDNSAMRDDPTVVSLVERARAGDQGAWDRIVERFSPLVWSVCRRHGLSGVDAEDVTASVWLRLIERLGSIREPAALAGWIATTSRRECLRVLRAASRQVPTEDDAFPDEAGADTDGSLLEQERHIALRLAFAGLSERCRRLLSMLFDEPTTPYADIAATLGIAIGGIGPTRMRCLDRLRDDPHLVALMDSPDQGEMTS
jgi:RNA polymerase sigma factor (sigma-70 family)